VAPRSASLSLLLLILTPGCAYATKVKRPDGSEAFRIHCADRAQCQEKATEVCAGDYEVVSSSTQMDGYVDNGTGYAERPHEMVIACRADVAKAAPRPAPPGHDGGSAPKPPAAAAAPPAEPAREAGACADAGATIKETAAFWAQLYPEAKRLEEAPAPRDFAEVCRALPERVQRCLDARYRAAHDKPCLAVLRRLDPGEKNKIDSLFLE
jgi:hypothetical protein